MRLVTAARLAAPGERVDYAADVENIGALLRNCGPQATALSVSAIAAVPSELMGVTLTMPMMAGGRLRSSRPRIGGGGDGI